MHENDFKENNFLFSIFVSCLSRKGPALKLVSTNLYDRVLGTSTAAFFLSNDRSLYAPFASDECHV